MSISKQKSFVSDPIFSEGFGFKIEGLDFYCIIIVELQNYNILLSIDKFLTKSKLHNIVSRILESGQETFMTILHY